MSPQWNTKSEFPGSGNWSLVFWEILQVILMYSCNNQMLVPRWYSENSVLAKLLYLRRKLDNLIPDCKSTNITIVLPLAMAGSISFKHRWCFRTKHYQQWCNLNKVHLLKHLNMFSIWSFTCIYLAKKERKKQYFYWTLIFLCHFLKGIKGNKKQLHWNNALTSIITYWE